MSQWRTLLETARYAPSPHNVQPWRLRVLSDDTADLLLEKHRTLPKEDTTGNFIILSMGLFIEALTVIAENSSCKLTFQLHKPPSDFTPEHIAQAEGELLPFARLTLEKASGGESVYPNALFLTRRTSRISYLPDSIPDEAVAALSKLAHAWGHTYTQVTVRDTIEKILKRNIEAVFEDLNVQSYHDEIVEWFRFSDRAARTRRDGLDYRCMNSSRVSFWLAARLPQLMQSALSRRILEKVYRRQLGNVPTIGMLAGPFWAPENAFAAGRLLLRFWLELAKRDLYIHPYGNLVTNRSAAEWCQQLHGVSHVWLIFRIGFSNAPPRSYRRTVEEVLVD